MDAPIYACLLVDDPPANATYWARLQQLALGYVPADRGGWGTNWRNLEPAAWFRPADAQAFADVIEEFGVRGKFTLLPCPAGLGRIDQTVRGYGDENLAELLTIVRDRIAPQFDIAPEVLTHSMALDIDQMALLPHAESALITHWCVTRQIEPLRRYLRFGYQILRNVGLEPHGLTIGGMNDVSNIAPGLSTHLWHGAESLGEALLSIEREFDPATRITWIHTGAQPRSDRGRNLCAPEPVHRHPDGGVAFYIHRAHEDVFFPLLHGPQDRVDAVIDAMVTPDLSDGLLVREAESGRTVVVATHGQTLNAMNSGAGIQALREALRRLDQRYGKRVIWQTCRELCARLESPA